jgi:hypothetical protein
MKRIVLFLFIISTIISCEDPLSILPPDGQVKDEYWKKKEDVEATLMGAYQQFARLDERLFFFGELRGDMIADRSNLPNDLRNIMFSNIYPWNWWVEWQPFYSVINYCNLILLYSPQVKLIDQTFTDYENEAFKSEAVFLRSLAYLYLVKLYKDVPFVLEPYDTDNQDFFIGKTSGEVILDSLESQLNRITQTIPESYETNAKTRGRATRGAVNALLADIALWKFDYESCIQYVENIEESDLYELVPGGEWFRIFSEGNTLEGIFELQYDSKIGENNATYRLTNPNSNYFEASTYAIELLSPEITSEVVRGNGTIDLNKTIWKYIGAQPDGVTRRPGVEQSSCNWIIYRMADVLLMKAEALSQIGRYDEALTIVNNIHTRAFMPAIGSYEQTASAFEDLILEQRAKELAFEGKRWFDLLRMGRRNNFQRKDKLIELIVQNVPATQKRVLASKLNDMYGWYFPIYVDQIENNPNMDQNPYYQIYEKD